MFSLLLNVLVLSSLTLRSSAAPAAAPAATRDQAAAKARELLKPRQTPTINAADNVWPQISGGSVVLDLPDGQGADPGPSVSGRPYASSNLAGFIGVPLSGDARVPSPSLIPAQTADAKVGLILDFESVPTPQPIRGTTGDSGGTDDEAVGMSQVCLYFC